MNRALTKQEWLVMEAIWDNGPLYLSELLEELKKETGWAQTTLATYLKRLASDGYVNYDTVDRKRLYRAAVTREQCMNEESRSLMSRMSKSSKKLFVTNMIREGNLTETDHQELKQLIEELEETAASRREKREKESL